VRKSEFSVKRNLFEKNLIINFGVLPLSIKSANWTKKMDLQTPKMPQFYKIPAQNN
jgi:hypothetical protein